ncbi:MAG: hypothetical protein HYZ81_24095 [Nitrospinae bacterium]|nr:hypothetical protein [Nitrospinota bacterium]
MFQILEAATLLRLLDAAPNAIRSTIEQGPWAGCLWPGHPEWEIHEACVQVRSLALHHFTVRYPAAEAHRRDTAAQLLASQVCPQGGDAHLNIEPLVDQALLWLWAMAGGPAAPHARGDDMPPPHNAAAQIRLPGGDPTAFTTAALAMVEALLFAGDTAARQVAEAFLRAHADPLAHRALRLVDGLTRQDTQGWVDVGITCADCGAQDLELWYSGKTWGDTLCMACYEARVARGQARPPDL